MHGLQRVAAKASWPPRAAVLGRHTVPRSAPGATCHRAPWQRGFASQIPTNALVTTSTLSNGVRVATDATPGHFSALGIYVDTGSRFERPWVPGESGVSHLVDRLAFKVCRISASVLGDGDAGKSDDRMY